MTHTQSLSRCSLRQKWCSESASRCQQYSSYKCLNNSNTKSIAGRRRTHHQLPPVHKKCILAFLYASCTNALDGQCRLHAIGGKVICISRGNIGIFCGVDQASIKSVSAMHPESKRMSHELTFQEMGETHRVGQLEGRSRRSQPRPQRMQ